MLKGILWSAICRNGIVLAEAGEDQYEGQVITAAQKLLKKKATHGFEFVKQRAFKGIKFHVFDETPSSGSEDNMTVWSFAAVAETSLSDEEIKSFLEKLVYITEPMRESEEWRNGEVLCAQVAFAPILLDKMENVTTQGKLAMVNAKIDTTKEIMAENIELALERQETLESLQRRSEETSAMARQFKKRAKDVKRFRMMQNAKHGLIVGTLVTGVAAAVVVPPLVALL